MTNIKCFWTEPTGFQQISLRVYRPTLTRDACPVEANHGYHQAWVKIEDAPVIINNKSGYILPFEGDPNETRWPTECACGEKFSPVDVHQWFEEPYYRRVDTGEIFTQRAAPAGAMWHADWLKNIATVVPGPDGLIVVCHTGYGDWCIDDQSQDQGRWTRTGEVPYITVTPSIVIGDPVRFHANLINGELVPV